MMAALRQIPGLTVRSTSRLGDGLPDLCIGYRGVNHLVELKMPGGKLTEAEQKFSDEWCGSYIVTDNLNDLLRAIGALRG